ncbi:hypothetical protein CFD26_100857 [Aspergillus turcosus]|uniref:D-xylose 1-dehydrogenase (NADP(+), D-xylono-1,5-lactone-forming) n=1 Tax=Aspergillus turcosus TaxID=1245748 RepID=A0A3R7F0J1_9EURO|nr:hypothetical protein CFD26_100857 [Aspergillus turcosus]
MVLFTSFLHRIYALINPPSPKKQDDALRFGLLGASNIAPMALIGPAKSHPEVIIAAVAARDKKKAEAYAKKHNIPVVHLSYQELLDDPAISCVYIALPNALHFEWALRALRAGKHVLLEKPSCSNTIEARALFNHPLATAPNAPVLLEAFHYRFHPAWQTFLSLIHGDRVAGPVKHASCQQYLFKGYFPLDDIRFNYSLAGGCLMDFGTYSLSCLRQILGSEPEVTEASYRGVPPVLPDAEQVDLAIRATYRTQSGATGVLVADLASSGGWPSFLPSSWTENWPSAGWPKCVVELGEKAVDGDSASATGDIHTVQRTVTMWNFLMPTIYHRIDVLDMHTIRRNGSVVQTWTETKQIKAYDWPDKQGHVGEQWWTTYRYQLEEFVDRVKGRPGSGVWIDGADSIAQMEAVDRTYEKAGLKPRPTSEFAI